MVSGSLFTLLFGVLFTFPSQYWFSIGLSGVFSLTGWCRQIQTGRLRPRPTQDTDSILNFSSTGLSPSAARFPTLFMFCLKSIIQSYNPQQAVTGWVWAPARSLATTCAITVVFFSSGYLDVSVPRVRLPSLRTEYCTFSAAGCPIRTSADIIPICGSPQLFAAYHVLLRL